MSASGRMPPFDRLRDRGGATVDRARVPSGERERENREPRAADHQTDGADRERSCVVRSERHRRAGRAEQQGSREDGQDVKHHSVLQAHHPRGRFGEDVRPA